MKRSIEIAILALALAACSGSSKSSTSSSSGSSASSTAASSSSGTSSSMSSSTGSSGTSSSMSSGSGSSGTSSSSSGSSGSDATLIDLPSGAALDPILDPTLGDGGANPNSASPAGLAFADGKIWVALGNLHPDYSPAGNSFLAAIDPNTQALTAYELSAPDGGLGCLNAGSVAAHGTDLVVTCTSDYVDGNAVVFDTAAHAVTQVLSTGGGPFALAVVGDVAYFGDSASNGVMVANLASGTVTVDSAQEAQVCTGGAFDYVSGLAAGPSAPEVLATCFDSTAGFLQPIDPTLAVPEVNAGANTQPGPVAIAYVGTTGGVDSYAVLDTFAPAVQIAQWPTGGMVFTGSISLGTGSGWNDVASSNGALFVAGGSGDDVARIDMASAAITSTAPLPAGSDPSRIVATDAHTAWATLLGTSQVAKVQLP